MNKSIIINGSSFRYISELPEFSNGLPFGIINKKLTDVGGTYCAVNCNCNYIIVVPFKDLATSIELDENNKYSVFKLYGGILKSSFKKYLLNNDIKKIVVTYDSLNKLINWLGESITDYKVLVDEYHLILEDLDFRDSAINSLLDNIIKFKHYSFLSATPINSDFEFEFFKNLPHYEIDWGVINQIRPFKIKTPNIYKATIALINEFKKGLILDDINNNPAKVKELHIFINSVQGIAQICKTSKLKNEEIRIICSDKIRNNLILDTYTISDVSDKNASINFYTKKGFQGCNIFSNNALIVVVSDAKLSHTLVDIETTLIQIVGRLRLNDKYQNIFRHKIYHIYSTNSNIKDDNDFENFIKTKKLESKTIYEDLLTKDEEVRSLYIKRLNFESDFLSVVGNNVLFNERKEQLFRYKFELRKSYKDGLSIRDKYINSDKFLNTQQLYSSYDDIVLTKISSIKLEDLYNNFLESDDKELYQLEYPEFFEYQKYLTIKEMSSLRWNKDKINKLVLDKKLLNKVHSKITKLINSEFISRSDLKELYDKEFKKEKINITAKATLIEVNPFVNVKSSRKSINGLTTQGYIITKNKFKL